MIKVDFRKEIYNFVLKNNVGLRWDFVPLIFCQVLWAPHTVKMNSDWLIRFSLTNHIALQCSSVADYAVNQSDHSFIILIKIGLNFVLQNLHASSKQMWRTISIWWVIWVQIRQCFYFEPSFNNFHIIWDFFEVFHQSIAEINNFGCLPA